VSQIQTRSGTIAYQLGTRSASTTLRLKDGENQVLAGLIQDDDRTSGNRIPGLGSIPILGRLFGGQSDSNAKTEIVLSITPRLVRNVQRPDAAMAHFDAGTEASLRNRAGEGGGGFFAPRGDTPQTPSTTQPRSPGTPTDPNTGMPTTGTGAGTTDTGTGTPVVTAPGTLGVNAAMSWQGPTTARAGETFALQLTMQTEAPIVTLPLVISFDPKVIEVVGVTEGTFMRDGGVATTFSSRVDPSGQVIVSITRQATTGASTLGNVITLNLRGIAAADSTRIQMDNVAGIGPLGRSVIVPVPAPYTVKVTP